MEKIFETISSFHEKLRTTGKVKFPFLRKFLLALSKFSVCTFSKLKTKLIFWSTSKTTTTTKKEGGPVGKMKIKLFDS